MKRARKQQYTLFIVSAAHCGDYVMLHCASPNESVALERFRDTLTNEEKSLGEPTVNNCTSETGMKKHFKYDGYFESSFRCF